MKKLLLSLILVCACNQQPSQAPKAPSKPLPPPPVVAQEARLDKLLAKVLQRQTCNRVSGCPASANLCKAGPRILPMLDEALNSGAWGWQRCRLYWILGCVGGEGARSRLLDARSNEGPECRLEALLALARLGDQRDLPLFQQTLQTATKEQDPLTQGAAGWGLAKLGQPEGSKTLLELLAKPGEVNPGALTIALEAVTALRLKEACKILGPLLAPREVFSLRAALTALEDLGCPGYEAQLQSLTTASWPSVVTHAARLLKRAPTGR
jgi:HEAT repeat protein